MSDPYEEPSLNGDEPEPGFLEPTAEEEVVREGLPDSLVASLRIALGTDSDDVLAVLRSSLRSSNEKIALDAARIVIDAVHKMPRPRQTGEVPRTVEEIQSLSFAEAQAAAYVIVSQQAASLAAEHGEEKAAEILWDEISPLGRAVMLKACA